MSTKWHWVRARSTVSTAGRAPREYPHWKAMRPGSASIRGRAHPAVKYPARRERAFLARFPRRGSAIARGLPAARKNLSRPSALRLLIAREPELPQPMKKSVRYRPIKPFGVSQNLLLQPFFEWMI